MWYLISAENPDVKFVLLVGREYTVGRKDCDIPLSTDPTVSRKHAVFVISHPESNLSHPQKVALVTLKDVSKFGTWVNKKKVNQETAVKDGDEVAFGSPKSTFFIVHEPFVITTSCLDPASKRSTKAIVRNLGGHIVSEWTKGCSLLVMNSISVTIKVICAMITQKSIVLPTYLEKYEEHLQGKGDNRDPDMFLPHVSETQVNPDEVSFRPNPDRASVFSGMKFIFLSQKQFKKMYLAVELAGGMPVLMEEGSDDNDDRVLAEPGTVVMNCGPEEHKILTPAGQEWADHVMKYLKRKKKHVIQDAEIGYAVLYCSTARHCNPNLDTSGQLFQHVPSQSLSQSAAAGVEPSLPDVLVANTEVSPSREKKQPAQCRDVGRAVRGKKAMEESVVADPEVAAVKNETISQPSGHDSRTANKRSWTQTKEETQEEPAAGSKRIKQEVVTPRKHDQSRSPESVKDTKTDVKPEGRKRKPSPVPDPESVAKSRGRRSPSPTPGGASAIQSPSGRRSARGQQGSPTREITPDSKPRGGSRQQTLMEVMKGGRGGGSARNQSAKIKTESVVVDEELDTLSKSSIHKPGTKSAKSTFVADSDEDIDGGAPSTRNGGAVKTPSSRKQPKTEVVMSDEDFDTGIRSSSTQVRPVKDPKTEVREQPAPSAAETGGRRQKRGILDDSDEEEDVSQWKRRRQRGKTSHKKDDESDVMDILSSKDKRGVKSEAPNQGTSSDDDFFSGHQRQSRNKRNTGDPEITSRQSKHRNSPSPSRSSRKKVEVIADSDDDMQTGVVSASSTARQAGGADEENATQQSRTRNDGHPPAGFLTTTKPIKHQVVKREDFVKEEDLPTSVMVTEFADLVVRRPRPPPDRSGDDVPDGFVRWNGKLVRNFKKFKKTPHAGSNCLPRIIGGSDLVVHLNGNRKDMDDWFREALQAETQQTEREREEQDLFNWEPRGGGRNKRSR